MLLEVPTAVTKQIPGLFVRRCVSGCQPRKLPRARCAISGRNDRRRLVLWCWDFPVASLLQHHKHTSDTTATNIIEAPRTLRCATYSNPSNWPECDARQAAIRAGRALSTFAAMHCFLCCLYTSTMLQPRVLQQLALHLIPYL